jgi:hypothetical protein
MHTQDHRTRSKNNVKIINLLIAIAMISANLMLTRDVRHFGMSRFVTLCLLDVYFPVVALACGLASLRFLKFTLMLLVLGIAYVLVGVVLVLSS